MDLGDHPFELGYAGLAGVQVGLFSGQLGLQRRDAVLFGFEFGEKFPGLAGGGIQQVFLVFEHLLVGLLRVGVLAFELLEGFPVGGRLTAGGLQLVGSLLVERAVTAGLREVLLVLGRQGFVFGYRFGVAGGQFVVQFFDRFVHRK